MIEALLIAVIVLAAAAAALIKRRKTSMQQQNQVVMLSSAEIVDAIIAKYGESAIREQITHYGHADWMTTNYALMSTFDCSGDEWDVVICKGDTRLPEFARDIITQLGHPVDYMLAASIAQVVLTMVLPLPRRTIVS